MKQPPSDPASSDTMSDDQAEILLAEALEDYHRTRARGERPDDGAFEDRLGPLYAEFQELVAAETLIDQALQPATEDAHLPMPWGAYTLVREIARGAAGVVYEAIHRKLGRKVALKLLRTGVDTDKNARERFQREAQALAHVKHDNIVEIYEFGEIDGRPYYAMSLVDGDSLMQLEKSGRRPSPRELCRGLAGVADALATLHASGIIHRDVKPQNIIVDRDGRYMLADFGLARSAMAETMTRSGDALGTPLYMSPEQMLGDRRAIEERTDVYGLGASLYQLLTGAPPFRTDNLHALMRMILKERPEHPRALQPDLPEDCARIALKCLEKEAGDRYESAAALRDDMLAFADGNPVAGKPVGRPRRGLRRIRRHPVLAAAAMILVAVGAWAFLRPPAPATLELTTDVEAIASLNDGDWKATPWARIPLEANRTHSIEIVPKDEAYLKKSVMVQALPGGALTLPVVLEPKAGTRNYEALDALRNRVGVEGPDVPEPDRSRGGEAFFVQTLLPRGDLRLKQDLDEITLALGSLPGPREAKFGDGEIVFFRGEELIGRMQAPEVETAGEIRLPVPDDVRARLQAGDEVRWGYRIRADEPRRDGSLLEEATFRIVAADPAVDARVAKAQETVREAWTVNPTEADKAARILGAEILLDAGLPYAAYGLIQAPYRARQAELAAAEIDTRERERDAILRLETELTEARDSHEELLDTPVPADPKAAEAHEQAIARAEARVHALEDALDAYSQARRDHEFAPDELRSLPLLALQHVVLKRLFSGAPNALPWAQHTQWSEMFDRGDWKAYYQR